MGSAILLLLQMDAFFLQAKQRRVIRDDRLGHGNFFICKFTIFFLIFVAKDTTYYSITVVSSYNVDVWVVVWDFSFSFEALCCSAVDLFCCQTLTLFFIGAKWRVIM